MAASIQIQKLTKTYAGDTIPALNALTLRVGPGEVYGFLGANGAGKSTTIRLLMNFLQPTSGSAQIMELDCVKDAVAVKEHVGYLAGDVALYPKATGRALLDYLASLQGTVVPEYRGKLEQRFEAELDKPIGELSKGNRQKIGIIQAFMHQPQVLILDEPTSGLDPLMQEAFYETVHDARASGASVLMSSHNLAEAQAVCDRVGIIKHGKLIHEQAIASTDSLNIPIFRVTFASTAALTGLRGERALSIVSHSDSTHLVLRPSGNIADALAALSRYEIRHFTTEQLNLEDEFMEFYGDKP